MRIGIPRALYYYRYGSMWKTFFMALDCEVIVSPQTDRRIMQNGMHCAIDEACLSSKIYLGHVAALIGDCDYIFIPRLSDYGREREFCLKFRALPDVVRNTFRDRKVNVLSASIGVRAGEGEMNAFMELGKKLGKKRADVFRAYTLAKQADEAEAARHETKLRELLSRQGLKILLLGHVYNIYDNYIGRPITDAIAAQGAVAIPADLVERDAAYAASAELTDTMPWQVNRELAGAAVLLKDRIDGVILLSSFACGPDSMTDEIITRRLHGLPMLTLTLDGQDGTAGMETRVESFVDILHFRKGESV